MRIVIDLQGAQGENRKRGIGRYSLSLVSAIIAEAQCEVYVVLSDAFPDTVAQIRSLLSPALPSENILIWSCPGHTEHINPANVLVRRSSEYVREAFLASLNPSVILICSLFEGLVDSVVTSIGEFQTEVPTAVILYDLIPFIHRKPYLENPSVERWYENKLAHLRRASAVLAISNSSRDEGVKYLSLPHDIVTNISTAADDVFKQLDLSKEEGAAVTGRYGLDRPYLMYTGGIDHRKNIEGLITAYSLLPKEIRSLHQLAIVCSIQPADRARLMNLAKKSGMLDNELILTGFVPELDLVVLYNRCKAFVFPSWHEGFGLPALEAMSCGKAVIGSNRSSIPEVIGKAEALFDPFDQKAFTEAIRKVLVDDNYRIELERHSNTQAKKFSWQNTAKCALSALDTLVTATRHRRARSDAGFKARKLRLAYVSPLPPDRSGISDYSVELLPEISRHYSVDVVSLQPTSTSAWVSANCTIRTIDWFRENHLVYDRVVYHFGNSSYHQHMFSLLEDIPGVVVLHDFYLSGIISHMEFQAIAPQLWTKELYVSHGYSAIRDRFLNPQNSEVIWKYPCNVSVLRNAIGVIIHSDYSRRLAKKWYGCHDQEGWADIPLLRVANYSSADDKAVARKSLGYRDDDFIVCSFGLLGPSKLNDRLLSAWLASSLASDQRCVLVFVGENDSGEYGARLGKEIQSHLGASRISITGWADPELFRTYLIAADVGVQLRTLSRGETSAAVLDCMNYGLATIANVNGSMADLPDDGVYKLSDDFKIEELVEALIRLRTDSELRLNFSSAARNMVRTRHSPRSCADQYAFEIEQFYRDSSCSVHALTRSICLQKLQPLKREESAALAKSIDLSLPPKFMQKQIFVDVSELCTTDARSGIQRVVRSILNQWLVESPSGYRVEPVYANADRQGYYYARQFTMELMGCGSSILEDEPITYKRGDIFVGLDFQPSVIPIQLHQLERIHRAGVSVKFVLYDMLLLTLPACFPPHGAPLFQEWLKVVTRFDAIISISRSVQAQLQVWLQNNLPINSVAPALGWFHLGADIDQSLPSKGIPPGIQDILNKLKTSPTFLLVGTIEPRKGHAEVLAAFESLWAQDFHINLVVVGKQGWMVESLVERLKLHPQLEKQLYWLEGISDEALDALYSVSTCLIAASTGEGFGLPLIEAAQHNLPIIARDLEVFREVAGDSAYYFSSGDGSSLAEAVQEWLVLHRKGEHPSSIGMPWLSWKESALALMDELQKN